MPDTTQRIGPFKLQYTVELLVDKVSSSDVEQLRAGIERALDRAYNEGTLTPDDDDSVMIMSYGVRLQLRPSA